MRRLIMKKGFLISIIPVLLLSAQLFSVDTNSRGDSTKCNKVFTLQEEEIEKTIQAALDHLKQGDWNKTVDLLSEAIMLIKSNQDFHVREITLCSRVEGFRDYTSIGENTLKKGTPLLLYIEPGGYRVLKESGEYKIWLSEDAKITNEKGEVVFERNDWVNYKKGFPSPDIPFYITNRVTDIPAGTYTFTFTIKDHYKKTFLTETFEFVVQ
jgi:hypothetical protein